MRSRLVAGALLAGLIFALPSAHAADPKPKAATEEKVVPTVVVRLAPLDRLIDDTLYLAEMADKEEEAKQIQGFLKNALGDDGIAGVDTKRPIALYARVAPKLETSAYALMVPIADEKAFLELLAKFGQQGDKGKDGIYKVEIPRVPFPLYYRFANKYVYVTVAQNSENLADKRLLAPEVVFPAGDSSTASATINFDQIPEPLRDQVRGLVGLGLGQYKARNLPNETEAHKKLRIAAIDEVAAQFKTLLNEGQNLRLGLNINRKQSELSLSLDVSGKPGSGLARTFGDLGKQTSIGASLIGTDSAASALLHLALPASLRRALEPVLDEGYRSVLERIDNPTLKDVAETLLKGFDPTLKLAEADAALDLRGPGKNGKYTAVLGMKVKDGARLETALKNAVKEIPEQFRQALTLDAAKAGGINIHKIAPERPDPGFQATFGDGPVYFAVRDNALLVSAGEESLPALKEALAARPKESKILGIDLSLERLVPLLARENKSVPAAAKKAFKDKGSDRIRVVLEGGKALTLRATMRGEVIRFLVVADELKKKEQ